MYNTNIELKDYNPKQEFYMAKARRKTTIDEHKEIVNYCIEHNRNYKEFNFPCHPYTQKPLISSLIQEKATRKSRKG